uniref:26S proteasome non-ATPase regulatory subunit 9 n=1 Tax=Panagrellus redivivus TaxID=6233 RepID=A0A7E4ZZD0_PANRE
MTAASEAKKLLDERDALDRELDDLLQVLKDNKVDMTSELVDAEGFPRNDIDVYSVRDARVKIIRLQNDRAALSKQLEDHISQIHSDPAANSAESDAPVVHRTTNRPFLQIAGVADGSPADEGGLKANDLIVQFGTLHGDNYTGLEQVKAMMQDSVGKTLKATILREHHVHRLTFQPRQWSGNGVFGAGFVPYTEPNA